MRKIQKAGKIHQHYKMKILLNAKVSIIKVASQTYIIM